MAGFVYVMSNPSFSDGQIKVGKSSKDPREERADELYTTGVPQPFKVEYIAFAEDYDNIEKRAHSELSSFRTNKSREFFSCSIPAAISKIREISGKTLEYEKVLYVSPDEIKQHEDRVKCEQEEKVRAEKDQIKRAELHRVKKENKNKKVQEIESRMDRLDTALKMILYEETNKKFNVNTDTDLAAYSVPVIYYFGLFLLWAFLADAVSPAAAYMIVIPLIAVRIIIKNRQNSYIENKRKSIQSVFFPKIEEGIHKVRAELMNDPNWSQNYAGYKSGAENSFRRIVLKYLKNTYRS